MKWFAKYTGYISRTCKGNVEFCTALSVEAVDTYRDDFTTERQYNCAIYYK